MKIAIIALLLLTPGCASTIDRHASRCFAGDGLPSYVEQDGLLSGGFRKFECRERDVRGNASTGR